MKSIYAYKSYRVFLKDRYLASKQSSPSVKLSTYAKQLGLSPSGLVMIFSGERNLTVENLHGFADAIGLAQAEHEYFEALVLFDQAVQSSVRKYYGRRLKEISQAKKIKNMRISDRYVLNEWFVPALLVYVMDFELSEGRSVDQLDFDLIAKKFNMPATKLRDLIQNFVKSGLLEASGDDQVHVMFDRLSAQLPQKNYIKAVLTEMLSRVDSQFSDPQSVYRGFVFSIENSMVAALKVEINALFEKYMSQSSCSKPILMQGLVALSPVIKPYGVGGKN